MSLRQSLSLSQQIYSTVIDAVALTSFYLFFALSHADVETFTPVDKVGIAGTLLSTHCAQDTPTFNLFPTRSCLLCCVSTLFVWCSNLSTIFSTLYVMSKLCVQI